MATPTQNSPHLSDDLARQVSGLEARLARIEAYLNLEEPEGAGAPAAPRPAGEDIESRMGRDWFAKAGLTAVAAACALTLALPYRGVAAFAPPILGYLVAAAFWMLGRLWRRGAASSVSAYAEGCAAALAYVATLRLCYFGAPSALRPDSIWGAGALALGGGGILALAWKRRSPWLFALGLAAGCATALAVPIPAFGPVALVAIALTAAGATYTFSRAGPVATALGFVYASYALWAIGDPFLGRPISVVAAPSWGPAALLACLVAFGAGLSTLQATAAPGEPRPAVANAAVLLNVGAGYGLFLLHTLAAGSATFFADELAATAVLLALAIAHARRPNSVGAFLYALTAFLALSFAIIKVAPVPDVFVWLSLQSLLVVATAIALRSRFMVVANFLIFVAVVAAYAAVAQRERGISIGFGLVALGTARLLGWKRDRLDLRTETMRNAYLATAFVVFPYALYHLVARAHVGLAWVAAAGLYYAIGAVLRNAKYRWMGHGTLLLTAGYLLVIGIARLEPLYRNLSLLILGAAFLTVSLLFTRARTRGRS